MKSSFIKLKKLLSFLLVLSLIAGSVPVKTFAAQSEPQSVSTEVTTEATTEAATQKESVTEATTSPTETEQTQQETQTDTTVQQTTAQQTTAQQTTAQQTTAPSKKTAPKINLLGAGQPAFTATYTTTYANGNPYTGQELKDGDKLKYTLNLTGPNRDDVTAGDTFTIKVPKIFNGLTAADFNLPKDGSLSIFQVAGPTADTDPAYDVYTFTYTPEYINDRVNNKADTNTWLFSNGTLILNLQANINETTKPYNKPVAFVDTSSGTVTDAPPTPVPVDTKKINLSKIIQGVYRQTSPGTWTKITTTVDGMAAVKEDDVVVYRLNTDNAGNVATGQFKIYENLPEGLEAYDADSDANLIATVGSDCYDFGFSFNKTNDISTARGVDPDGWTATDGTGKKFEMTIPSLAVSQTGLYGLFYAKVKDLESGNIWTNDQLKNVLTSDYSTQSVSPGEGPTMDPVYQPKQYDLALTKWIYEVKRGGKAVEVHHDPYSYVKPTLYADDIVTFAIRVTNQGKGDSSVKLTELTDYVPQGLEYDAAQTAAYNGSTWTAGATASPGLSDATQDTLRTITKYKAQPNVQLAPTETYTTYMSFKVKDLDQVLQSLGISNITSSSTAAELEQSRTVALMDGLSNPTAGAAIYSIYYNAAEISAAETLDGTPIKDGSTVEDVDSSIDDNPFNDPVEKGKSLSDYPISGLPLLYGKEKDDVISDNVKAVPSSDEDDYDFAYFQLMPKKLVDPDQAPEISKVFETIPLRNRQTYADEQLKLERSVNVILDQLTPGHVSPWGSGANGTGDIQGTSSDGSHLNPYATDTRLEMKKGSTGTALLPADTYKAPIYKDDGSVYIPDQNTIIPYTVSVNPTGVLDLSNVVVTDQIPAGYRLLMGNDGHPITRITRFNPLVDNTAVSADDPTKPFSPVTRYDMNTTNFFDVKQFVSQDWIDCDTWPGVYQNYDGTDVRIPQPDAATAKADYWSSKITNTTTTKTVDGVPYQEDQLTVNLGDIGHDAYDVTFFVVPDRVMGTVELTNTAKVTATERSEESTSDQNIGWNKGAIATFYHKDIMNGTNAVTYNPLDKPGITTVNYRIAIKSSDQTGTEQMAFNRNEINIADTLKLPSGVTNVTVNNINVTGAKYDPTTSAESALPAGDPISISNSDVTYDAATKTLNITNSKAMSENRRYYVTFDVTYDTILPGAIIKNTAGSDVYSYAPVAMNLLKEDAVTKAPLKDAEFTAYYADATGNAPDTSKLAPITDSTGAALANSIIKTGADGKADFLI